MADRRVSVGVDADVSAFVRGLTTASASAKGFAHELESADGRMANLVQTGLALAPALVPIGAAAVPAIAGLTLQLGLAAGAAGVAVLAFQGIGDSLKALDAYQLSPTADHFAKLQQEMEKLGPAGQEFVLFLNDLQPRLKGIRAVAEQGLLPGVEDGLSSLVRMLPQVNDVVFTISSTLGDLAAQGGANLAGPQFREFFDYIETTARPVLTEMGQTFGNFFAGFAEMLMAFDPLSRSFSTGLLDMSRSFRTWADGLSQTQGFSDFVAYIQANGPRVVDTLGSLGNALVQLVEAAAPVGPIALGGIRLLADSLAAIADSPVGPVLISTAAAVGVLGRSLALLQVVGLRGGGDGLIARTIGTEKIGTTLGAIRSVTAATEELTAAEARRAQIALATRDAQGALIPDVQKRDAVKKYAAANREVATAAEKVALAEHQRSVAIRDSAIQAGKAAALVGGFALATSGLADKTGLSNTASLALMGTIAGPWGAAIGGGIGLVKDLSAANESLRDAISGAQKAAADPTGLRAQAAEIEHLRDAIAGKNDSFVQTALKGLGYLAQGGNRSFNQTIEEQGRTTEQALVRQSMTMRQNLAELYASLNGGSAKLLSAPLSDVEAFASQVEPALQAAGLSFDDLAHGHIDQVAQAVRDYNASMESASGKSAAVASALKGLADEMTPTATAAENLKTAMDSLFGVELSQAQATDQWSRGLKDLRKQIADTNGAIYGNSNAALDNRAAIQASVQDLQARVTAEAAAGASGGRLAKTLVEGRKAIIAQATAAGASRAKVKSYLDTLGLAPKNLRIIIDTPGLLTARQRIQALTKLYNLTPKQLRTIVSQFGADPSIEKVRALARQYGLTPKQVLTLLKADDQATAKARNAKREVESLKDKSISIRAKEEASAAAARARAALASIHDKDVRLTVTTVRATVFTKSNAGQSANPAARASGGPIPGYSPNKRADNVPIMATAGEYMHQVDAVNFYGLGAMDAINQRRVPKEVLAGYAYGGKIEGYATGGKVINSLTSLERAGLFNSFDLNGEIGLKRVTSELASFSLGVRRAGGHLDAAFGRLSARARAVSKSYDLHSAALDAERKNLDKLRSDRDSFRQGVTDQFRGNIFGHGATFALQQLQSNTRQAQSFSDALSTLQGKGISRDFYEQVAASGDIRTAQQLAGMSRGQIDKYDSAFAAQQKTTTALGNQATTVVYASRIRESTLAIQTQTATLRRLNSQLNSLEKAIERTARGTQIHVHDKSGSPKRTAKEVSRRQRFAGG